VDEWLNQVFSSNIDPPIYYYDPKVIPIPGSDKVIVVIHVPESPKKPHMVSETHQYFIRINDSSKPSTHNQVREMFDFSRHSTKEYREFLKRRHILDVEDPNFGTNPINKLIYSEVPELLKLPRPHILYSIIPQYTNQEIINLPFRDLRNWLRVNSMGYEPDIYFPVVNTNELYDISMDGVVFKKVGGTSGEKLISYFEIQNNGYIEVGFSRTVLNLCHSHGDSFPGVYINSIIGYLLILMGFSRKFYPFIKYYDEVVIQISFINVLNFSLTGIDEGFGQRGRESSNKYYNNLKVGYKYNPMNLSDSELLEIGRNISEKICRGFGFETDQCFSVKGDEIVLKVKERLQI
jgi:hypothetical protein